jgi:hypothetical protein
MYKKEKEKKKKKLMAVWQFFEGYGIRPVLCFPGSTDSAGNIKLR